MWIPTQGNAVINTHHIVRIWADLGAREVKAYTVTGAEYTIGYCDGEQETKDALKALMSILGVPAALRS